MIETALGAFGGALAAFGLESFRQWRNESSRDFEGGCRVLIQLVEHWNYILQFQRENVEPTRGLEPALRALYMSRPAIQELDPNRISFKDMAFLIDRRQDNLALKVLLEDKSYRQLIRAINTRSELHAEKVQRALSETGYTGEQPITAEGFRSAVGEQTFRSIISLTDDIVRLVDSSSASLDNTIVDLRAKLNYLFPRRHVPIFRRNDDA